MRFRTQLYIATLVLSCFTVALGSTPFRSEGGKAITDHRTVTPATGIQSD